MSRSKPLRSLSLARRGILALILILTVLGPIVLRAPPAAAQLSITIDMRDALTFEPNTFSADPGENVTFRVVNGGFLRHTFTLFAEVNAQVPVSDNAALQDFYANNPNLLDIDLQGGQEATVNFTVPAGEGVYTLVCMVSNHAVGGMHGLMFVGMAPGPGDFFGGIGIVQGLFIFTLIGVGIFAFIYHVRSSRP